MFTKLKTVIVGVLVAMLLPLTVMAAESDPLEVLMAATANSFETSYILTGELQAFVNVNNEEEMTLIAGMEMAFEMDLDEEVMKFFVKIPMSMEDPRAEVVEEETFGMFFDGENFFLFMGDEWFADPYSPGMDMGAFSDIMQISLDLSEYLYTLLPVTFSDLQVEGYYVIDIIIGNYEVIYMLEGLLTVENIATLALLVGEEISYEELEWLAEDLAFAMDYIVSLMDYVDLHILFRNFINAETLKFSAFDLDMDLLIELEFFGTTFNMELILESSFVVDYESEIVWPAVAE